MRAKPIKLKKALRDRISILDSTRNVVFVSLNIRCSFDKKNTQSLNGKK